MDYYILTVKNLLEKRIDVPERLLELYALLVLVKGEDCSLEDVHDAWAIYMYKVNSTHPSIIPFKDLSEKVQELDRPYQEAIVSVSRELSQRKD